jgi:CHAT domain-containing protein
VVHFATHGVFDNENPDLSGIFLSLYDQQGRPRPGFLGLHDIYAVRLPVELVVLSACNTALGRLVRVEGLVGIVRGFIYAGARRVVASLWKVDDEATAELMRLFYVGLFRENRSPAAALRQAQLDMRQQERWRAPFYWAGFVLQGEWK